jgi:hypothetical protein
VIVPDDISSKVLYQLSNEEADEMWATITSTADRLDRARDTVEWFAGVVLYDRWVMYAG